jgi:hypothetical protein
MKNYIIHGTYIYIEINSSSTKLFNIRDKLTEYSNAITRNKGTVAEVQYKKYNSYIDVMLIPVLHPHT